MKKLMVLIFAAAAFTDMDAHAADARGAYSVLGHGSEHCGIVLEEYENGGNAYANMTSWVNGYLTAVNAYKHDKANIAPETDMRARMEWIINFCKKNPFHNLAKAAHALYKDLRKR